VSLKERDKKKEVCRAYYRIRKIVEVLYVYDDPEGAYVLLTRR